MLYKSSILTHPPLEIADELARIYNIIQYEMMCIKEQEDDRSTRDKSL